jgi:hypothetical protein
MSDSDDEREAANAAVVGVPAYNLDTWSVGRGGPQCSQKSEFCYFCAFNNPNIGHNEEQLKQNNNDDFTALWDIVDTLVEQKKEIAVIIHTVHTIYSKHVRPTVKYIHPDTNKVILTPTWSKDSIKRHLLFSSNYPELFDNAIDHMFQAIIYSQNNTVMDPSNMSVIEDRRSALMDTIGNFSKWKTSQHKISSSQSKAGKNRKTNTITAPPAYIPSKKSQEAL